MPCHRLLQMINCINDACLRIVDRRVLAANADATKNECHRGNTSLESVDETKQKYDSLKLTFFFCLKKTSNYCRREESSSVFINIVFLINSEEKTKNSNFVFVGVFLFLPIAVNLFLIQHKESKRYLCGENNQLFGLVIDDRTKKNCLVMFFFF